MTASDTLEAGFKLAADVGSATDTTVLFARWVGARRTTFKWLQDWPVNGLEWIQEMAMAMAWDLQ